MDNASYHKSKAVLEDLEEFGGDILGILSSTRLNPARWSQCRNGTPPADPTRAPRTCTDIIYETGEIKTVKTYDYLTVPACVGCSGQTGRRGEAAHVQASTHRHGRSAGPPMP